MKFLFFALAVVAVSAPSFAQVVDATQAIEELSKRLPSAPNGTVYYGKTTRGQPCTVNVISKRNAQLASYQVHVRAEICLPKFPVREFGDFKLMNYENRYEKTFLGSTYFNGPAAMVTSTWLNKGTGDTGPRSRLTSTIYVGYPHGSPAVRVHDSKGVGSTCTSLATKPVFHPQACQ